MMKTYTNSFFYGFPYRQLKNRITPLQFFLCLFFFVLFSRAFLLQVTSLIRVCKTNCVVMRLLAGGHRREGASGPQFDFTVHPHLPIVKVT
jgi:hypothetical protein